MEEAIISGLYDAFYAGQELATEHVIAALRQIVPLARTMDEQIGRLKMELEGVKKKRPSSGEWKRQQIEPENNGYNWKGFREIGTRREADR